MKAAVYRRYGPPEVVQIEDVEKPAPKDNQVLIRIHATTVSAADWRMRRAVPFIVRFWTGFWRPKKIQILGMEFSGRVEAVGGAVTRFGEGDEVFGSTGFRFGTHAEYVCLPEDALLATKAHNITFEEAAAVLFGGVSALHFLRKANIQAGQNVLIYGASGSVGVFAVQLAKHFGAHVTECAAPPMSISLSSSAPMRWSTTRERISREPARSMTSSSTQLARAASRGAWNRSGEAVSTFESAVLDDYHRFLEGLSKRSGLLSRGPRG